MPTVIVNREALFASLGKTYTDEEFDELCFEFGIELDDVTSEKKMALKETGVAAQNASDEVLYKIEVPANRYDMLCFEGICQALKTFLGVSDIPNFHYSTKAPKEKLIIKPETQQIRPFAVAAVLRNVTFTPANYKSFIDLQDKLHQNVGRRRTLVSIGTHDLDTIKGPFSYEALPPKQINFVPLNDTKSYNGEELFKHLEKVEHLKKYLPIIADSPVYPVIYDSNRVVLSLPPIINGDHSKITLQTKNVFIEVTATDLTKAEIALNMIVAAFSEYAGDKYSVEPVEIVSGTQTRITPNIEPRIQHTSIDYINKSLGLHVPPEKLLELLRRMSLPGKISVDDSNYIDVTVPPTRSDILHECDVMEDVAIAYGYNNLPVEVPKISTVGKQQPLNKLSDQLRAELAQAGFIEVLTFALVSKKDNFTNLNKPGENDINAAVTIANAVTAEFQIARTNLLAGLLRTVRSNRKSPLPLKLYEVSDVVLLDNTVDVGSRNNRRVCAVYSGNESGFGEIHGLLDRLMLLLEVPWDSTGSGKGYSLKPADDPTFFPGMCADFYYNGKKLGIIGVVHPEVLKNFEITTPVSAFEIEIEQFV